MTEQLARKMAEIAGAAVENIKELYDLTLPISEDALEDLEGILATISDDIADVYLNNRPIPEGLSPQEIHNIGLLYGAFLGEIIRRRWGGEWTLGAPELGINNLAVLRVQQTYLFPTEKVYKRLTNGPEDNIYFYFVALKHQLRDSQE